MLPLALTSLQHPIIKHLTKLRKSASYRKESQTVLISGKNLIEELSPYLTLKTLLYTKRDEKPHPCKEIFFISDQIAKKITGITATESYLAEVSMPRPSDLSNKKLLLVTDQIQDPGNLGTLLRSALAFGIEGVFLLEGTVDLFNDKVIRSAKGANFLLPYQCGLLSELNSFLKTHKAYLADLKGAPVKNLSFEKPCLLILGNEGKGVTPLLRESAFSITIPMTEKTESLNVSIAGSIIMYEMAYGN